MTRLALAVPVRPYKNMVVPYRAHRRFFLAYRANREAMTEVERQVVRDYRRALLDWPESAGFPDISTMPVLPNA